MRTGNNINGNNNFLTPNERAFHIRQSIEGIQRVIDKCMKHYEETGDLAALEIARDGYVTLADMLRQVKKELYYSFGHGHDFELTR